jgi:hypothetical protein
MRSTIAAVSCAVWVAASGVGAGQRVLSRTFDADRAGAPPDGFTLAAMRQATPGAWTVRRDGTKSWLEHAGDPAARGFSLAIANGDALRDVAVSARVRLSGGARVGGVIWRYVDANHYHAAILDLDRGEISMFRVSGGNRVKIESEDDLELDADAWHTIKAVHTDDLAYVTLGGIRVFEERSRDDRATPGRAGVIAAGDATMGVDDLRVDVPRNRR